MKKPPSFTKNLLEKLDSEINDRTNKNGANSMKMKYFDKIYFQKQSATNKSPIEEISNNPKSVVFSSPNKNNNYLSRVSEVSATNSSMLELSSSKKPKEFFVSNPSTDSEKNGMKDNKIVEILHNDNIFEKIKQKIIEYSEENKDFINTEDDEDEDTTDLTNFGTIEDFFDKKRDFTTYDDIISLISEEDQIEYGSSLFEIPEKNSLNDKNMEWRNKFVCSSGGNLKNLNEHITSKLEKMLEYHINEKHHFEANAYRKAIAQLKNSREKITVVEDLKKIKNLGSSISGKIKEILLTGKIRKAEFLKNNDEKNVICASFMKIHGIGIVAAINLYKKGYRTIEDLRNHLEDLNSTQKIGLKYYEDIQLRIPREECEEIFNKIKEELLKILPENIIEIVLCGSYRRGKSSCGDMDILITRKDNSGIDGILSSLITSLKEIGLVKETFTNLKTSHDNYVFMGMMQLKESLPNRRVDIKVYKRECFAFALLYFTGSAYFNRSMRLLANKLGFSLSDQGLVKVNRIKNEKIPIGENIECSTEEDIFKALGLSYKTPSERDI